MDNRKSITCVGLGEVLWDILPTGPRLGGAPANFAFHSKQMGLQSQVVSCVGNDEQGDKALSILDGQVDYTIFRADQVTGYVKASIDERGIPTYDFALDTAYDHIPLNEDLLKIAAQTQVCCFGSLAQRKVDGESRKTILAFLDHMSADSIKVFDINLRQNFYCQEVIIDSLKRCNAFKCNDEELPIVCSLLGKEVLNEQDFYHMLREEFAVDQFIYTCGENGSHIFYHGEHSFVPTPKVEVVDTVGAGDSFTATFIALTTQGVDFKQAHLLAVDVAAYICTQPGALALISPQLRQRMDDLLSSAHSAK